MTINPSANQDIINTAQTAFQHFSQGLATGEWNLFLEMLTDDFSFWFPIGQYRGLNVGKEKAAEFFNYVSQVIFTQGLTITLERMTSNETTVVFEVKSTGLILGKPYENLAAISFDLRGDRICGYREYLAVVVSPT